MKYLFLLSIILTGCMTKYRIPSKKYGDKVISTSKNSDGTRTVRFYRHNLEYVDIANRHKLLDRKVYNNKQVIYRYPILEKNVKPSEFYLKSGNDFLMKTGTDTLVFINDLPIMNRHFWGKGVMFSRITENTYLVRPSKDNNGLAKFYISTTHNYEEIENDKGFIADSLIVSIR
jgi:hypothetical protein